MALSDEDRGAIKVVRRFLDEASPGDLGERAAWERVLKLAGEEPPEPADGTFWLDEEECDVLVRDDKAVLMVSGPGDLYRWYRTGDGEKFSWIEVCRISPKLVELVRATPAAKKAATILYELASAWQSWHHENCGRREPLGNCQYHECAHRWRALLGYGLEENWEG